MSVSEFDTLAELRADIEERIREVVEHESNAVFRGSVLDELSRQLETEVPEALVRSRMAALTRDLIDSLAARGVTTEQYLRLTGQTSEQLVEQLRPQAEDAVRKDLALEAVAEDEQVEVSDEMVADWVREQAAEADEDAEAAVERFTSDAAMMTMLRTDLRLQKALDIAVDNAKEITPEQAEARAKLWTPEKESEAAGGKPSTIWTPGSPDAG
jgi:trigger factor